MNFAALDYIDPISIAAWAMVKDHAHWWDQSRVRQETAGSPYRATRSILLRGPETPNKDNWREDGPSVDYPVLGEWAAAKRALDRCRKIVRARGGMRVMGHALVEELPPGTAVDWHTKSSPYHEAHRRFCLPLVSSPVCILYVGGEQASPPVGVLTEVAMGPLESAANFGRHRRWHLIVDFRRPE